MNVIDGEEGLEEQVIGHQTNQNRDQPHHFYRKPTPRASVEINDNSAKNYVSGLIGRWKQESLGTEDYSPMRMQQSVKLSSGQGTKDSKDLYKGNPSKLGGTGTGTDFDLNNREPDIENVEDDDAPSDGIHDGDNTLDDDVTR